MKLGIFVGTGSYSAFEEHLHDIGGDIAAAGHTVICTGANVGLTGALVKGVLAGKGQVVGIIHKSLYEAEGVVDGIDPELATDIFHEQDKIRNEADILIFMPGGVETLAALFHTLLLIQTGVLQKHVYVYNIGQWLGPLLEQLTYAAKLGLCRAKKLLIPQHDFKLILEEVMVLEAPVKEQAKEAAPIPDGYYRVEEMLA